MWCIMQCAFTHRVVGVSHGVHEFRERPGPEKGLVLWVGTPLWACLPLEALDQGQPRR